MSKRGVLNPNLNASPTTIALVRDNVMYKCNTKSAGRQAQLYSYIRSTVQWTIYTVSLVRTIAVSYRKKFNMNVTSA